MAALDVIKNIRSRLRLGSILPPIHPLAFEHPKETFSGRIVGTAPHCTHAAGDVVCRQELLLVRIGSKLQSRVVLP